MKREVLFRGKLSHNNKWLIGNLVFSQEGTPYIIPSRIIEQDGHHLKIFDDNAYWVNNDTIGQYIGLKDSCEDHIFEGDILLIDGGVGVIIWDAHSMRWGLESPGSCAVDYPTREDYERSKVIGNIYDNENIIK